MALRPGLARLALRTALSVRTNAGHKLWEPLCVFDLAEKLGIDVWFVDSGSLEGMYWRHKPPAIFLSAHRPSGRQAFTCGHELGHHLFRHGSRVDEIVDESHTRLPRTPEEFLADAFSGFLLMPKVAVSRGFQERGWDPSRCLPEQAYVVAHWLGVGYTTLVSHMCFAIRMIPSIKVDALLKAELKLIRVALAGQEVSQDLIVVDEKWTGRAVDAEAEDLILVPIGTEIEGSCLEIVREDSKGTFVRAIAPGCGRFFRTDSGWATYVRVSRREYVGRNMFRHLEEADENE